jgi:hypothetical protein
MDKRIEAYHLGDVQVVITETSGMDRLQVDCNDGAYHSAFEISRYEYENYKRHMNQRIKIAFDKQHKDEE